MKHVSRVVFAVVIGTAPVGQAQAEPMYVNDKLVVGVYSEMDSENGKVASLETGDAVEMLERQDKYFRVRLSDGREGWVKANYLSEQAPAIVRLKELQAAANAAAPAAPSPQLVQELAQLKEQNSGLLKEVDALKQAAAAAPAHTATIPQPTPATGASIEPSATPPFATPPFAATSMLWFWLGGVSVAAAVGFALGYQVLARRIRRKYGSVKIY